MPTTMDPESTILPKGIVVNSQKIYDEIAAYDIVPKERVWEIWRVYTTTTKELQDPTARRLENFWWHVLGSDRQYLKGRALARIFEEISLGPTAVPLKGPPNRWDGDIPPHIIQQALAIMEAEKQYPHQSETALNENSRLRDLSSSAARPPASHPILKKPRGPSTSGPRPTARFVSPQPSEDEGDKSSAPSSTSTITPALEMRQHVPNVASPSKKKSHAKKIVASTAAAKRRPVLPRKKSSQSSVTSDSGSKDGPSSGSSRGSGTPLRAPSPIAEGGLQTATVGSHEPAEPSAKALGKRPVVTRQTTAEKLKSASKATEVPTDRPEQDVPSPPLYSPYSTSGMARHVSLTSPSTMASSSPTSVPMAQSRSHSGFIRRDRPPFHSSSRSQASASLSRGLFTGPTTASTTNVAATGTIIDQGGSVDSIPTPAFYRDHAAEMQRNHSSSSLFDLRFTPTQPTPGASVPLGRTKSQLTLVLERDEARAGKKPRSKS